MKTIRMLAMAAAVPALAAAAQADTKIGMITTLSGGGAGLGVDVRAGFMLAIEQDGRDGVEVVIEDDQRKPESAVQLHASALHRGLGRALFQNRTNRHDVSPFLGII